MKAKTLLQVLSLSTNLYVILKDEELMNKLSGMVEKGREHYHDVFHPDEDENPEPIIERLLAKAKEAKAELEERLSRAAESAYAKMHIAHTKEIEGLQEQLSQAESRLRATEARLAILEQSNPIH
jgi:hypothetical protein